MATMVLQTAGAALGSIFGPIGSAVGRAAGALAGSFIDRSLFGEDRIVEGSRLTDLSVQESREGAPIPRVFGRTRLSGQIIWATEFEEVVTEEEQGGKGGGPSVTSRTFSYFANFAVAICEGEIAHIGRIWADGELLDTNALTLRIYKGDETQEPDSLIAAKQGIDETPAYRGTAYVVFERLPLEAYGNRLPQFAFEVIRPVGALERSVKAVQLIPGASEFLYDVMPIATRQGAAEFRSENRHIAHAETDLAASLDELQAVCPALEQVAVVASWFGADLRCGTCTIRPKVEVAQRGRIAIDWEVSGLPRHLAQLVSMVDGAPAFGGTPSDAGIIRTIRNLRERGLRVSFNPFLMMDIPPGNGMPDPYGDGPQQPVYPWRGRITANLAPGQVGSPDKTDAVRVEIAAFLGAAQVGDFHIAGTRVSFSGGDDWGYRRFILHAAHLCKAAGGVDTFLIGSEMRGLTWLRDAAGRHPFVDGLIALAADVRTILGPDVRITYGADWTEYFGYQPADGSGDVVFHLDPLWADANIDAIGIDNYMPLADWRDGDQHLDAADARSVYDLDYLKRNVAAGEGYDWFYASRADRDAQIRTPITDGAHGKPWVFRYKDLVSWWSNVHINRPAGIENGVATAYVPRSKPIVFTEFGCPAIDKGANQPNVFFDPGSSESALPYFSSGTRDDAMQRAFLEAGLAYWNEAANNPVSPLYGGSMVDIARTHLWTWDARPYPAFPHFSEVWADAENWRFGHWLNGRLGGVPLGAMIGELVETYTGLSVEISNVTGTIDGYVISDRTSARNALETLLEAYQIDLVERAGNLVALPRQRHADSTVSAHAFVAVDDHGDQMRQREQEAVLPSVLTFAYQDIDADFRAVTCSSRRLVGTARRVRDVQLPIVASYDRVLPVAERWLQALWLERDRIAFALPPSRLDVEVGDLLALGEGGEQTFVVVSQIEEGTERRLQTRTVSGLPPAGAAARTVSRISPSQPVIVAGPPDVAILDLPLLNDDENPHAPRIAAAARPWPGGAPVFLSVAETGFALRQTLERPAFIGTLESSLDPGPTGVFDPGNQIEIVLPGAALSGIEDMLVFAGRNAIAIRSRSGAWEVLQFADATLIGADRWRLSRLLRAQAGTEDAMAAGFEPGAAVVLLNGAVGSLDISRAEAERPFNLKVGLSGRELSDALATTITVEPMRRGLRPLSPVHLRVERDVQSGDLVVSWIRRTRIDGDLWEVPDVPLGEEREEYEIRIFDGDILRRTLRSNASQTTYEAVMQQADFGVLPLSLALSVAQISASEGPGTARRQDFHF